MITGNYFELLREFFITDFKLRYKHSYLGFLWVVLKPLSYYVVLFVIWTSLLGKGEDFASYLMLGILTLTYFVDGVIFGMQSLYNKAHIILKVNFPREVVVFSAIGIAATNFFINLGIYFLARIVSGKPLISEFWYWGLLAIILETILLLGISFFTSIITVTMQDIKHLIELVLQLIFWATPIFYSLSSLPAWLGQTLTIVNPLVIIVSLLRAGLIGEALTINPWHILVFSVGVVVFTVLGYIFFKAKLPKIAERF
ncbi:MAG: ABC transporter permease [Candidatus Dojkabacteria bacterium]|nr:MAG: ABC transporter permease [Candidatus Dojkabacteria bacterium]